jgi:ornithine cyclodeaminase
VTSPALWLTEDDVRACATVNDVVEALGDTLVMEARGEAGNLDKALATWGPASSMHALGSMMPQEGFVGFKTWANTPNGAAAIFSLFSAETGALLALLEAGSLGQLRTSAISGLATRQMAAAEADEMALIGAGAQAMMQVAAVAATRKLRRLRVFSRTPGKRAAFVAQARELFDFDVVDAPDLASAVADAPIVTLITRTIEPFLEASLLARGTHVNAAGAVLPANAEFHQDLFDRADLVVVDNLNNAAKNSREMIERFGKDVAAWKDVKTLGQLMRDGTARPEGADLTLFKPMGMGLSDLAVATLVYKRALERNYGLALPAGGRGRPAWTAAA